jgi:hypothetical protein
MGKKIKTVRPITVLGKLLIILHDNMNRWIRKNDSSDKALIPESFQCAFDG